jgi:hypothetical protein
VTPPHKPDPFRCRRAVENLPDSPWVAADAPTYTLDPQVADARRLMGEREWQRLDKEWL